MVIAPHSFHVMMVETGETRHRNGLPENPSPNYDGLTEEREEDMREDLLEMRGWPAPLSGNPSTGCGVRPPSVCRTIQYAKRAPHARLTGRCYRTTDVTCTKSTTAPGPPSDSRRRIRWRRSPSPGSCWNVRGVRRC